MVVGGRPAPVRSRARPGRFYRQGARNPPHRRYSFTDCTSFVLLRRLGLDRVAALDEDFRREGFELVP